ncbi:alkaline phosphatase family protein [Desertihabitans aurantiacus]|uniref:alkaline phosphatase family protein n=1 Tax=Desertihabitans aurantiacus TaxID=2282477 RepID=UPI001E64AAAE|nr:nucleotide pyrophosphatase/phosphodiesterase family protein [Desertihabitans aurantiacus]
MAAATTLPEMVLPAYGSASLTDLLPTVAARLGRRLEPERPAPLPLPEGERWVVMLVDGLGWDLLRSAAREAPYLGGLTRTGTTITAGVPSTTVTSLSSLGTGLPPGGHGMAGYMFRLPHTDEVLNALVWDSAAAPRDVQPRPTVFEALKDDVAVSSVAPARFRGSGLTFAALRGPSFVGLDDEGDEDRRIELIVQAATGARRTLVYGYERALDHTGHVEGSRSEAWLRHLIRIDAYCARLRQALPDDVRLVVTGDHGMVDVAWADQLVVEDEPELLVGVHRLAGEGRLRQLHLADAANQLAGVTARWRDRLGEGAWVRTRDEAFDEGWFGPADDRVRLRFGDVLVAMRGPGAVMTRSLDRELSLVGMHGSLTSAEMRVPLLVD